MMREQEQERDQEQMQERERERERERILLAAEALVKEKLERDSSGHDWWHIYRVVQTTKRIAAAQGADRFVCELAALLHDVADEKLNADPAAAQQELEAWLAASGTPAAQIDHVLEIIGTMSFKGGARPPMRTLEGQVVQDADRLDAIGAVGIARVFAYSGWKGRPIHDPSVMVREQMTEAEYRSGNDTAINHFYEKLLKLKELMNTDFARKLAEERHLFMEQYLEQFYAEWDGER
nr:HD domain-containing protein [Paenibacillus sedimenti]